jgi:serine/threonine-protein kinase
MYNPGMLINDRYEIIEKIGTGGMSVVYKARCTKLQRYVAIKILKDEYCLDEAFVRKFRVEAQAAASLSHSNIVNIYDVGNENKTHFIVMEYLEGQTLKEYIKEKGKLDDSETLKIGACIASALEHAHANHIIHRDIKPQNIMITKDGKVKVTDFGIARIATDNTINVQDSTSGSVHYIAPEQAKGVICDEKSDIYSLGISMYEMITGEMPFVADSLVSVCYKQIHDKLPDIKEKNPEISVALEQIIIKATMKKPEARYLNAEAMLNDLKTARNFPNEEFIHINKFEDDSPTINISESDFSEIRRRSHEKEQAENEKKLDKIVVILGTMSAVILVAIIAYFGINYINEEFTPIEVNVPNVVGMTKEDAMAQFETADPLIDVSIVSSIYSDEFDIDTIINQTPSGIVVLENGERVQVDLVASKGLELFEIPDVVNLNFEEAEELIREAGFKPNTIGTNHDIIPLGEIISQEPEGLTQAEKGAEITLYVSLGKEKVYTTMPSIINLSLDEAVSKMEDEGLVVGNISYSYNDYIQEGNVITANVEAGEEIAEGYIVNLVVSDGKELVTKKATIHDLLSASQSEGHVQVHLIIDEVETIVYDETVARTDFPIIFNIEGRGTGIYVVYLDGEKEYSDTIVFTTESE